MKMTTFKTFTTRALTVASAVVLLAACSDGAMSKRPAADGGSPALNAPTITSFMVRDANDINDIAGESADITSGGSVILSWDVTGAKSLEISRLSNGKKLDLGSSLESKTYQVDGLTAVETFELTAFGDDAVMDQRRVTVNVKKREIKVISFLSKPATIRAGEQAELCWKISDADAKVKVMAGDVEMFPGNTVPADQPPADSYGTPALPADGYGSTTTPSEPSVLKAQSLLLMTKADVTSEEQLPVDTYGTTTTDTGVKEVCGFTDSPTKTTTYTLTAVSGDASVSQDYKLEVEAAAAQIVINFTADRTQLNAPGEARLQWSVSPADATVDIDHGVATKQTASGTATVPVSETTTYTLTATTPDGRSSTSFVTVTVGRVAGGNVTAKLLTPSVFAGESVKIAVTSDTPSTKLAVRDPRGNASKFTVEGNTITISDPVSGSYAVDADGSLANTVNVEVRQLDTKDIGAWNGLGLRGLGLFIAGDSSGSAQVNLTSFSATSKDTSVAYDFGKVFAEKMKTHADYMSKFAPYTVNAVTFSPKGRAFAGMTGGVLYSDNSGASWNVLDVIPAYDTSYKFKDKEESHPGCFGSTRKGTKSFSSTIWMVNVFEVCDLAYDDGAEGKDRLLIATDFGAFYIDGVDGRIKDPSDKTHAMQGTLKKDNALFGKVVNKIVIAKSGDQKVVVAAASDGVYINTKRGDYKSWQPLNAAGLKTAGAVNTVAVSGNMIFAGTDKGLFTYNGLDTNGQWKQLLALAPAAAQPKTDATVAGNTRPAPAPSAPAGVAVKSLAVDAADAATLYVGTKDGLKLSRDCGASFVDVAASVGSVRNIATATEGGRSAVVLTSDKGLFSSVGATGTAGSCNVQVGTPQQPEQPKTPVAGNGPGTGKPNS